jgi:hypothetical protein
MASERDPVTGRVPGRWWVGTALVALALAALSVVSAPLDAHPGSGGAVEPLP